jgi:hypothetical protein
MLEQAPSASAISTVVTQARQPRAKGEGKRKPDIIQASYCMRNPAEIGPWSEFTSIFNTLEIKPRLEHQPMLENPCLYCQKISIR